MIFLRLLFRALFHSPLIFQRFFMVFAVSSLPIFHSCQRHNQPYVISDFVLRGDIINLMSSAVFRPVPDGVCARHRFPWYKSGWYPRCCAPANRPDAQCLFRENKMSGQTGGGDCAGTPCLGLHPPAHRGLSYPARCFFGLTVFHSLLQRLRPAF